MSSPSKPNLIGSISHFFASNRPLSVLILIAVLGFGLASFFLTPKQYNPEIVRPAFAVSLEYTGATIPAAVDRVVYELVEKLGTIPGVEDIHTEVHDGATVMSTVIFEVGADATQAELDVRAQLAQHSYLARGFIAEPRVQEINPETLPVLQIAFASEALTTPQVRDRVTGIAHELGRVPEVSAVDVRGAYEPAVVVALDPAQLAENELSVSTVAQVLTDSQLRRVIEGQPQGALRREVVFDARASTPEELGLLSLHEDLNLGAVADIYRGVSGPRSYVRYVSSGVQADVVMLAVAKREGSSAPTVTAAVRSELDALRSQPAFADLTYQVVADNGVTATAEIFGLTRNLLTSIAIVSIVLFLFLSARAAGVVLVAIPLTLLIVFGLGFLAGETINRITLFALILSLGLLVDSAIVVVENIYSHLQSAGAAVADRARVVAGAVSEIGTGLLLSTVTSVIVFLPMGYITGMMGPYMGPIAFFVPAALIVSFLVAIILTPFVAAHVLRPGARSGGLSAWFGARLAWLTERYRQLLSTILAHRRYQRRLLVGGLGLFLVSLVLPLTGLVHFQMLPHADRDQLYLYLDLPVQSDVEYTRTVSDAMSETVLAHDAVTSVQSFIGTAPILDFNGMFKGAQNRIRGHQATLRVNLRPGSERAAGSSAIADELREQLAAAHEQHAGDVRVIQQPPGPPVRATLVAKLTAPDRAAEAAAAAAIAAAAADRPSVVDVRTSTEAVVGRQELSFDRAAAASYGITAEQVATELQLARGGVPAVELLGSPAREYTPILLEFADPAGAPTAPLTSLPVRTSTGVTVPLSAVTETTYAERPSRVQFDDAAPVTYVTGEVVGEPIIYAVLGLIRSLGAGEVVGYTVTGGGPFGLTLETDDGTPITLRWGGEWEMTLENFRDLGIAMGVALLLVYALLVAQYRRFGTPAFILVTVPLGLVGILWGFLILDQGFGIYLTATALIGFIALIGLVVNNAIIYLEYVRQQQLSGAAYTDALVSAGASRLRPILLTSLTTVLGSLTIASDPVWSGLAWAIVFGLSLSTVLTLLVYPTLLAYFAPPASRHTADASVDRSY